ADERGPASSVEAEIAAERDLTGPSGIRLERDRWTVGAAEGHAAGADGDRSGRIDVVDVAGDVEAGGADGTGDLSRRAAVPDLHQPADAERSSRVNDNAARASDGHTRTADV